MPVLKIDLSKSINLISRLVLLPIPSKPFDVDNFTDSCNIFQYNCTIEDPGIILRTSTSNIKEAGRATQGVILIRLDGGDEIAAISKLDEEEEETETNEIDTSTDGNGVTPV